MRAVSSLAGRFRIGRGPRGRPGGGNFLVSFVYLDVKMVWLILQESEKGARGGGERRRCFYPEKG